MSLTKVSYSMVQGAPTNILDYGADPTGIADSTSAIQAAIDATPYGTVIFPVGTYKITSQINIVTDNQAGVTRRDRHLYGYGAVINCQGVGQIDGFNFSAVGPWPSASFNLFVEGFVFGGAVSGYYIAFSNADNFYENLLFEKITTTNNATGAGLFYFANGSASNLGGVTIRKCGGGPNIGKFINLKASATYAQFDSFTIQDNAHLGTNAFLNLENGAVLQYSLLLRNFNAGVGTSGINGVNTYLINCAIIGFYAEPKQSTYYSIQAELIECRIEDVVNTVADFTGKTIKVLLSGATKNSEIVNCKSWNGTTAPWESTAFADVAITYPNNVSITGLMESYFDNAVSYTRPNIFPANGEQLRINNASVSVYTFNTGSVGSTKTLYTFTNSAGGNIYDQVGETYDIEIHGQIYGGVTNFTASFELYDGTNTDTLATISTTTYANNRTFTIRATLYVDTTNLMTLSSYGVFNNATFTRPPNGYSNTGTVVRANNPALQFTLTTLNAQGGQINNLYIQRRKAIGGIAWT